MDALPTLPIDAVLEEVIAALRASSRAVLLAPPGAGKTTRVPPAILDAGLTGDGDIVVLEPRRLAARMAARRVAGERGEPVGHTVGYEVRFERKRSADTRIRFVTEGVLLRQLLADPLLSGTRMVVIDEFHERHLAGDLALALIARLASTRRPDLGVVVMSATLDPGPIARFLGGCPVVESAGRQYPVEVEYRGDDPRDWPLEKRVSAALRAHVQAGVDGHLLVFLPGAAEIRRSMDACADVARHAGLELVALHGDLPAAEQDRAVASSRARKLILSTNVAETSITIDGVTRVIDSGVARVARHSPWSGLPMLRIEPISQASAAQRAGRAGRTQPGACTRLYTRHDHDTRRAFDPPEVTRTDLAEAMLLLAGAGVDADDFGWFEPPPTASLAAAGELLELLGAVSPTGRLSEIGRRMLRFPVHPRQARVLVEAEDRGVAEAGCTLAALIGERDLRAARRTSIATSSASHGHGHEAVAEASGPSDLLDDLDRVRAIVDSRGKPTADRLRRAGLDPAVFFAVDRGRRQLLRRVERDRAPAPDSDEAEDRALLIATLTGYPDRVAQRRTPDGRDIVLCGGGSAVLSTASVVTGAQFLVAVAARERGRGGGKSVRVHRASAIEPAWLLDLYIDRVGDVDELRWNPSGERVERVTRMTYGQLVLDETRDPGAARRDPEACAEVLADAALALGVDRFVDRFVGRADLDGWRARLAFVAGLPGGGDHGIAPPSDDDLRTATRRACVGLTRFGELEKHPIMGALQGLLSHEQQRLVARLAPLQVSLPGRRRVAVHYEVERPPWIASRLQDFFGASRGPTVGGGAVPLVLHLLAPNQRAVQITTDLEGFWARHYPDVRRQLKRRYPKHAWPEDPLTARPG